MKGGFTLGFKVGGMYGEWKQVSHLFFVDYTIILCDVNQRQLVVGIFEFDLHVV